jgi:hypothetical protein
MTTLHKLFEAFSQSGVDVNASTDSDVWNVGDFATITVQAEQASGTFSTAILTLQCSADGVTYYSVPGASTTGPGMIEEIPIGTEFIRVRVTTLEGSVGTADITVNAKR